ncbi:Deoxyhypusine synthase [Trinorchestia longiramus]|nr:Deoxyhypusine synthase [Trinorchestia longiramus]
MDDKEPEFSRLLSSDLVDIPTLRSLCWGGIPKQHRAISWLILLEIVGESQIERENYLENEHKLFKSCINKSSALVQQLYAWLQSPQNSDPLAASKNDPLVRQILLDIRRLGLVDTSDHSKTIQMVLILLLVAERTPAVCYIQGMADLLEPVMLVYDDNSLRYAAYKAFVDSISDNLVETQLGVHTSMDQISLLLSKVEPETWRHLRNEHVDTHIHQMFSKLPPMKNESEEKLKKLISGYSSILGFYEDGLFQAKNLYTAISEVQKMEGSKVFFSFTENILSPLNRQLIIELIKRKKIHVIVTTQGAIVKDASPNLSVFENDDLAFTTPSELLREVGPLMHENSILHQASVAGIPIYCPTLLDGPIRIKAGVLDIVEDVRRMNMEAMYEEKTGAVVFGTGVIKHHVLNANLFKNGLDFCVLVNSAVELDGSDAGASVEEAVSWGKIKSGTSSVKVFCDPNIVFPLVMIEGFRLNQD